MIKTGPAYLACDGCDRTLWPGEGKTILVDVRHSHVCSTACARKVFERDLPEDFPKTPEEADSKQVRDAAQKVHTEEIKAEQEKVHEYVRAVHRARQAAIASALESLRAAKG